MKHKYQINEIVYVVEEYRVIKSIVDSITIVKDIKGEQLRYIVYPYNQKNKNPKKRQYVEAYLVSNLEVARQSALANWRTITQQVEKDLLNLKDEDFEPSENEIATK